MKNIRIFFLGILICSLMISCGSAKDSQGHYWKPNKVWKRITSK